MKSFDIFTALAAVFVLIIVSFTWYQWYQANEILLDAMVACLEDNENESAAWQRQYCRGDVLLGYLPVE